AGRLLPGHDRHRDEHDRRVRVHRRDHGGPRCDLAAQARRDHAHPDLVALGTVAHGRVRRRPGAGAAQRRGAVARPRLRGHAGAPAAGAARALAPRPARPARRAVADGAAGARHARLGVVEERAPLAGRVSAVDRTHLRGARRVAARLGRDVRAPGGIVVMRSRPSLVAASGLLVLCAAWAPRARAAAAPDTLACVGPLPRLERRTPGAGDRTPQAVSRLKRDDLRTLAHGQDTPMALATQPGAFAYSDAGNGIGYSYLTLRGFPQRRISVLVNGVPLN